MAKGENVWWICFVLFGVLAGASCVSLTISPRKAAVRPGDNLHVTCKAPPGLPLDSCKFFVTGMPGIDFSLGRNSQATDDYRYYGRGLERGYCGINLLQIAHGCSELSKIVTITCAAQIRGHGWALNYMSMAVTNVPILPMTVEQQRVVAQPGGNVTILCSSAGVALKSCQFHGKALGSVSVSQGHGGAPLVEGGTAERVTYFGQGLEEGECGITLSGVKDEWTGLVWCTATSEGGDWGYDYTTFIVAKSPSTPTLRLSSSSLKLGETLNATCIAQRFRPAVNISWEPPFDENLKHLHSDDLFDARLDYEEQVVAQETVKRVVETDHMKNVRCTVKYGGNKYETAAQATVTVKFCGKRNFRGARPLVYGGMLAKSGEFPWHVALYRKANNIHKYICGGSLLSTKHVITAAHCIWNRNFSRAAAASEFAAALGKYNLDWEKDDFAQRFDVAAVEQHSRYNDHVRNYEDDIAILTLDGEAVFSGQVHPICLDWNFVVEDSLRIDGNQGIVPGWGLTEHANLSDTLRFVELPYIDRVQCNQIVPSDFKKFLSPGKFCAGYLSQSVAVCGGDSGGGMVFYQNTTNRYYLLGLVSLAPKGAASNCNAEQVAAFTEISEYYPWIKNVLDRDGDAHVLQSTV